MIIKDKQLKKMIIEKGHLVIIGFIALFLALCNCYLPIATGNFIDSLSTNDTFILSLGIMILTTIIATLCELYYRIIGSRYSHNLEVALQEYLLYVVNRITPQAQNQTSNGEFAGKCLRDVFTLATIPRELVGTIMLTLVSFLGSLSIAFVKNIWLGIFFLILLPISIFILHPFSRRFAENTHKIRQENDNTLIGVYEFFQTLPYLKSMDAVFPLANKLKDGFSNLKNAALKMDILQITFEYIIHGLVMFGEYGILAIGGVFAIHGKLSIGDVVALHLLFSQTINSMTSLFKLLPILESINEGIKSIEEITLSSSIENDDEKIKLFDFAGNITLKNVSYRYPEQNSNVIENISLMISKNKCLVITGVNGAGKTTLIKLLSCYATPTEGEILYDGISLNKLNRNTIRKHIATLFQDSMIISGTVRENITLGIDYPVESIDNIIQLCGLNNLIAKLPNGLDTKLDNARFLSGGERQRIALARTLIRHPSVAIYDELTNHLDSEGIKLICELIPKLKQQFSIVIVTHDERIKKLADEIIQL